MKAVKYDVMACEFRSGNSNQDKPKFVQATLLAGLTRDISVYTGTQLADKYKSVLVGVGQNIGRFGAFSFDVTHANSELADGSNHSGQSFRFLYAKSLNTTGTTFQLLGYRYSTKGFYTLNDVAYKQMSGYEFAPTARMVMTASRSLLIITTCFITKRALPGQYLAII